MLTIVVLAASEHSTGHSVFVAGGEHSTEHSPLLLLEVVSAETNAHHCC